MSRTSFDGLGFCIGPFLDIPPSFPQASQDCYVSNFETAPLIDNSIGCLLLGLPIMLSSHLYWGGAGRGMVAGLLSFQHIISVDNRIYWYPKRCSCDYFTVLCAFF